MVLTDLWVAWRGPDGKTGVDLDAVNSAYGLSKSWASTPEVAKFWAAVCAELANRGVRGAGKLARTVLGAARAQTIVLPGTDTAADLIARMADEVLGLDDRLTTATEELEACFFSHPQARIVTSLPGMGPSLGAEFLAAVGDIGRFATADRLASYAGLAPVSRDSGKTQGRLVSTRAGNHSLKRVFFQSAFASLHDLKSRAYYDRKRSEGKRHNQAVLALARRRVDVLWAMLRRW